MTAPLYDLGTHKSGGYLKFDVTLTITVEGVEVDDFTDWSPACQFRSTPKDPDRIDADLLNIDGKTLSFGLPESTLAAMDGAYVADVQVLNPAGADGFKEITWPGGDEYMHLRVASDVTRTPAEGGD